MEGRKEVRMEGRKEVRRQKVRRKKGRTEYISKNRYVVYKDKN